MKYTEQSIRELFDEMKAAAQEQLLHIRVAEGCEKVGHSGLTGWVFEQTIRYCLKQELDEMGHNLAINEQVKLHKYSKVDLLVGKAAIEIKANGSYGRDAEKYGLYSKYANENGWTLLYLTYSETYQPYRAAIEDSLGKKRVFLLSSEGEWVRFVNNILMLNDIHD